MTKRIAPWTKTDEVGDEVPPFDAWLNGDIDYADLPDDDKELADKILADA